MIVEETKTQCTWYILFLIINSMPGDETFSQMINTHQFWFFETVARNETTSVNKMLIKPAHRAGSHQPYRTATRAAVKNADAGN